MAATAGITGLLAATGTGNTKDLLDNSQPYQGTLNVTADSFDVTAFAAGVQSMSMVQGLQAWTIGFQNRFNGKAGLEGAITYSSGYTVLARSYTLNITAPAFDATAFGATRYKTFLPGLYSFSGSYDVLIDGTTSLAALTAAGGAGDSATFKFGEENPNTDDTAAGNIITTSLSAVVSLGDVNRATYNFTGSGNLTFAGENTLITAGTLGVPAAATVTLTAASGKTYSGSAFWSAINIQCGIDGAVDISGTLQGTGDLTIA